MPTTFTVREVATGVWAAVAPGTGGPAVSNAAIVDLGGKALVVDTFFTMLAADELAGEVRRLTGAQAYLVVNTHWHADHVRGNGAFVDVPIVGTPRMNELIVADGPGEEGDVVVLPDVLIGDRLEIVGERTARVLSYGRAHTEVDLFVHLPDDGVLIAGDLVWTGIHPKTSDGFPSEWAAVADRLAALAPATVVPGHGPPGTAADVAAMAGYLRALDGMVAAARAEELDPATAEPPPGTDDWLDADRFRRGLAALAAR